MHSITCVPPTPGIVPSRMQKAYLACGRFVPDYLSLNAARGSRRSLEFTQAALISFVYAGERKA